MKTKLRDTWTAGRGAVNGWLSAPNAVIAEVTGKAGFDSVTIDLQHGLNDYQAALAMLQALAASDSTPMARVPWLEPGIIMKLLDAGALGIICPMVNTRADAERLVHYANYAPAGTRSFGPTRAMLVYGADYVSKANDTVVTLAMVETAEALENVEAIAQTPGLTGVYIGPSDLALFDGPYPEARPGRAGGGRGGRTDSQRLQGRGHSLRHPLLGPVLRETDARHGLRSGDTRQRHPALQRGVCERDCRGTGMSGDTNAAVRRADGQVYVDAAAMERLVGAIFERAGCDAEEAHRIAWRLTGANLRGHDSHGVLRTSRYVEWMEDGKVFPGRAIRVERETEALAVIDGDYGFGQTVGEQTVDLGVEKARRHGVAVTALKNAGHLGRIGDWAERADGVGLRIHPHGERTREPDRRALWRGRAPRQHVAVLRRGAAPRGRGARARREGTPDHGRAARERPAALGRGVGGHPHRGGEGGDE